MHYECQYLRCHFALRIAPYHKFPSLSSDADDLSSCAQRLPNHPVKKANIFQHISFQLSTHGI